MERRINWNKDGAHVAVVGATGAVGREMIHCLEALDFPLRALDLLASPRSVGRMIETKWGEKRVECAETFDFHGVDIALFSAGKDVSLHLAPRVLEAGALMIDNTSAFRRDPQWPLVVPEVNGECIALKSGIIANPNCSTIQMVLALKALDDALGIDQVRVVTYQSCSGAGQKGMDALVQETRDALNGNRQSCSAVHARGIAFDVVPQIGAILESGYTEEEDKMMFETRKILYREDLSISATCVRVPVMRCHSESVCAVTKRKTDVAEVQDILDNMAGLRVTDRHDPRDYPTAVQAEGQFETLVGRIRQDPASPNGIMFWIVSDNLLKGAALNAVQIAIAAWSKGENEE